MLDVPDTKQSTINHFLTKTLKQFQRTFCLFISLLFDDSFIVLFKTIQEHIRSWFVNTEWIQLTQTDKVCSTLKITCEKFFIIVFFENIESAFKLRVHFYTLEPVVADRLIS